MYGDRPVARQHQDADVIAKPRAVDYERNGEVRRGARSGARMAYDGMRPPVTNVSIGAAGRPPRFRPLYQLRRLAMKRLYRLVLLSCGVSDSLRDARELAASPIIRRRPSRAAATRSKAVTALAIGRNQQFLIRTRQSDLDRRARAARRP